MHAQTAPQVLAAFQQLQRLQHRGAKVLGLRVIVAPHAQVEALLVLVSALGKLAHYTFL
jgi:hypothetical protein